MMDCKQLQYGSWHKFASTNLLIRVANLLKLPELICQYFKKKITNKLFLQEASFKVNIHLTKSIAVNVQESLLQFLADLHHL